MLTFAQRLQSFKAAAAAVGTTHSMRATKRASAALEAASRPLAPNSHHAARRYNSRA